MEKILPESFPPPPAVPAKKIESDLYALELRSLKMRALKDINKYLDDKILADVARRFQIGKGMINRIRQNDLTMKIEMLIDVMDRINGPSAAPGGK